MAVAGVTGVAGATEKGNLGGLSARQRLQRPLGGSLGRK